MSKFFSKGEIIDWRLKYLNNKIILPISILFLIIFYGLESWQYTNYVYSQFGVNHLVLIDLVIFGLSFFILTASKSVVNKYWQVMLFFSFLAICLYIHVYDPALFKSLSASVGGLTDDNFMEWLQIIILLIGVIVSAILAKKTSNNLSLRFIYLSAMVLLIVFIGEEISWGERIFNFQHQLAGSSYQRELNLHNQKGANEITAVLYMAAFWYGFLSWLIYRHAQKRKLIKKQHQQYWEALCFRGQEVLYLLPTFIFNPYADRTLVKNVPPILDIYYQVGLTNDFYKTLNFLTIWRETFEVLFYAALVLHMLDIYLNTRNKNIH